MPDPTNIICLSTVRWHEMMDGPRRLMHRLAHGRWVIFVEDTVYTTTSTGLDISQPDPNVFRVVPHINRGLDPGAEDDDVCSLLATLSEALAPRPYVLWLSGPTAVARTRRLAPVGLFRDGIDDLAGALSPMAPVIEDLSLADLLLGVDTAHFRRARAALAEPADMAALPRPRIGFHGVIDGGVDLGLVSRLADAHPEWQVVLAGPIGVLRDASSVLPTAPNLHYLEARSYQDLPATLRGLDVALLPYVQSASGVPIEQRVTREYLAAGIRTVSTAVDGIINPYGDLGLIRIADGDEEVVNALRGCLCEGPSAAWLARVDAFLDDPRTQGPGQPGVDLSHAPASAPHGWNRAL